MSPSSRYFKLGMFVIGGALAAVALATLIGVLTLHRETVTYTTFFNESVQGLDTGAPVKFRGVKIGTVSSIEIAPDHRHVAVHEKLDVEQIERMGLLARGSDSARFMVPPDLRAQLGGQGITGVKFVNIDFFDVTANPLPELPFSPPENYIPAASSLMKNLEDLVSRAMEKIPELTDATVTLMNRLDRIAGAVEEGRAVDKTIATIDHADQVLAQLSGTLKRLDRQRLPERAGDALDGVQAALGRMNEVLDRLDGETGLLATAQRSIGDVGRNANGMGRDLDKTLRDVREAADAIRILAESLERDPDMLLKGRAKRERSAP